MKENLMEWAMWTDMTWTHEYITLFYFFPVALTGTVVALVGVVVVVGLAGVVDVVVVGFFLSLLTAFLNLATISGNR